MITTPLLPRRATLSTLPAFALAAASPAANSSKATPLDDDSSVITIMPFSARNGASRAKLTQRIAAINDRQNTWLVKTTQTLVAHINEVGKLVPGTFGAVN